MNYEILDEYTIKVDGVIYDKEDLVYYDNLDKYVPLCQFNFWAPKGFEIEVL